MNFENVFHTFVSMCRSYDLKSLQHSLASTFAIALSFPTMENGRNVSRTRDQGRWDNDFSGGQHYASILRIPCAEKRGACMVKIRVYNYPSLWLKNVAHASSNTMHYLRASNCAVTCLVSSSGWLACQTSQTLILGGTIPKPCSPTVFTIDVFALKLGTLNLPLGSYCIVILTAFYLTPIYTSSLKINANLASL